MPGLRRSRSSTAPTRGRRLGAIVLSVGLLFALVSSGLPSVGAAPQQQPETDRSFSHSGLRSDKKLARQAIQKSGQREVTYFLMPDRFNDGDRANNTGGIKGGFLKHGYRPSNKGYFHGGDLKGVTKKLGYLQDMGVTALWLAPIFKNNAMYCAENQTPSEATCDAQYHGYGIIDFTDVDPHFGTKADLRELIKKAHQRGMKVYFDIVANHTGDTINYTEHPYPAPYISKQEAPYKDATGQPFDDRDFVGGEAFPKLDAKTSFPYRPYFKTKAAAKAKSPAWLNDPIYYHNRGTSTYSGENSTYGDFAIFDDLFTENPRVVKGMTDIYRAWISDFGIDGYRIDTVKHVNIEFWQKFSPAIQEYAAKHGKPDFVQFGEVYSGDPRYTSQFTTTGKMPATLDFGFQEQVRAFASQGGGSHGLRDLFANDDYYTDTDSNAYQLPLFLGNHDMGRIGYFLRSDNPDAGDAELVARDKLAHALMYFSRGNPVLYYGDEQGFTGDGGDKDSREDMFGSQVASYNDNTLIGTKRTTAQNSFHKSHPLYRELAAYSKLRASTPAFSTGTQIQRHSSEGAGIYAFSRITHEGNRQTEYVVAFNNAKTAQSATLATEKLSGKLNPVWPADNGSLRTDRDGKVTLTVPPLGFVIYQASSRTTSNEAAGIRLVAPEAGTPVNGRVKVAAELDSSRPTDVTFAVKVGDAKNYTVIGTDTNAPYAAYFDTTGLAEGTKLTFRAIANDPADDRPGRIRGDLNADSTTAVVVPKRRGTVTFNVTVPADTPADQKVYIAGELSNLDPDLPSWDPGAVALTKVDATRWTITFDADERSLLQYKFTLGSWDREELTESCSAPANRSAEVTFGATPSLTVNDVVANWKGAPPC